MRFRRSAAFEGAASVSPAPRRPSESATRRDREANDGQPTTTRPPPSTRRPPLCQRPAVRREAPATLPHAPAPTSGTRVQIHQPARIGFWVHSSLGHLGVQVLRDTTRVQRAPASEATIQQASSPRSPTARRHLNQPVEVGSHDHPDTASGQFGQRVMRSAGGFKPSAASISASEPPPCAQVTAVTRDKLAAGIAAWCRAELGVVSVVPALIGRPGRRGGQLFHQTEHPTGRAAPNRWWIPS